MALSIRSVGGELKERSGEIMVSSSTDYDVLIPYLKSFIFGTTGTRATSFTIEQDNPAVKWVFKQLAVESNNAASAATTAAMYLNGVLISPSSFMSPTPNGLGVAASGQPYLVLQVSDKLTIAINGATVGDQIEIQGLYSSIPVGYAIS